MSKEKRKRGPTFVGWCHWMGRLIVENKPNLNLPARFSAYGAKEWKKDYEHDTFMVELFLAGLMIFLGGVIVDLIIIGATIGNDASFWGCLCFITPLSFLYPWYLLYVGLYSGDDDDS